MANKDLLIILPTRDRPENVKRFHKYWKKNTAGCSDVVLMTDTDDENNYTYTGFKIEQNDRLTVPEKLNLAAKNNPAHIIGFAGDDSIFETKAFDKKIVETLRGNKYGLLRPSNGYDTSPSMDHIFITRGLYKLLGWFAYPKMFHTRIDYVWLDIALALKKAGTYIRAGDIVLRHLHPIYDKTVKFDEIYKYAYRDEMRRHDDTVWRGEWLDDLEKIKKYLGVTVDLLMITHNRLEYTKKALGGILAQSYKEFNLLIWDNGSDKETLDWLDTIKDKRVAVVKNENNDALSGVITRVFFDSGAKYVGKIDPDTLIPTDWLERCVWAHENYHFGFIGGFHFRPEDLDKIKPNICKYGEASIWEKTHIGGCAFLIRKDDFKGYSGEGLFGLTEYQQQGDLFNGYLWDPILYVEHMEDARSPHCIKTKEYEDYKQETRGQSIEEYTKAMYINNSYLKENAESL